MNKRGISAVVATVLIILIVIMAIMILWIALLPMLDSWLYSGKVTVALTDERISIPYVGPNKFNVDVLDVIIDRGSSELLELEIENITETVNRTVFNATDVMLLVDLSGSMGSVAFSECIIEGINVNSPGSFCSHNETICAADYCAGVFLNGVCTNPVGWYNSYGCNAGLFFCGWCGGEYTSFTAVEVLKESAHVFVSNTLTRNNGSRIALMGYRDEDDFPYLDFTNKSGVLDAEIDSWEATGEYTYLYTGLEYAFGNFTAGSDSEDKFLIVLGDGGINDPIYLTYVERIQNVVDYISNFVDAGITVHSIGFGPYVKVDLFRDIANAGRGNYYNSSNYQNLAEQFRAILEEFNITHQVEYEVSIPGVFLDLAIFSGGDSYVHRIYRDVPGSNEQRRYEIELKEGWKAEDITKVNVYIVAISRGGIENSVLLGTYKV